MITSLSLCNFKNFADQTLKVGEFTVVIGANASGKSNLRDAFRILHGIGRGYSLAEIIGGKYGAGGQVEWEQIRGAAHEIVRFGADAFTLKVDLTTKHYKKLTYLIEIQADISTRSGFRVSKEEMYQFHSRVYTSHPGGADPVNKQDDESHLVLRMAKTGEQKKYGNRVAARHDQPALTQIGSFRNVVRSHKDLVKSVISEFSQIRFLDLVPDLMRKPAFPGQLILGDNGQNLPTVLQDICRDEKNKNVLMEWIRELTPMDVSDLQFPSDEITGQIQLLIIESNGRRVSAYSASDGTLRFLAVLAALLTRDAQGLYFFEEIDNGIHPARLRLLIELIETQASREDIQIITSTHSPELLSMINDETFASTSIICRTPNRSDAIIRIISDLKNANELRKTQGLGRLHASGWMEDAVFFLDTEKDGSV